MCVFVFFSFILILSLSGGRARIRNQKAKFTECAAREHMVNMRWVCVCEPARDRHLHMASDFVVFNRKCNGNTTAENVSARMCLVSAYNALARTSGARCESSEMAERNESEFTLARPHTYAILPPVYCSNYVSVSLLCSCCSANCAGRRCWQHASAMWLFVSGNRSVDNVPPHYLITIE